MGGKVGVSVGTAVSVGSDIGSSVGFLLNAARSHFEAFGVEPSRWAVSRGKELFNLGIAQGAIEEFSFDGESFDVIAMVDVVEHLDNPRESLKKAYELMRPGGMLYLVTPDFGSLSSKIMGRFWWGLRPAHLYYFTRKTMRRMLDALGFDVVEMKSYGRIFTLHYWLSRIKNYPRIYSKLIKCVIDTLNVRNKMVYINTRDSMEVVAQKRK